ncbi:MAG: hypothetical protein HRT68_04635 [Flavobacteriaceae bacterium]|nr:hypothetical protein [Flavobacteriaceae bacterium]
MFLDQTEIIQITDQMIKVNPSGVDVVLTDTEQAKLIVSLGGKIGNATKGSSARGSLSNANITM